MGAQIMTAGIAIVASGALFGILIGSFLNVVVYRVPIGMSLVAPASACPNCHSGIKGYDNIPVVSWLLLGGRCRQCKAPISVRYPLVEAGTAVFFGVVAAFFAPSISSAHTVAGAVSAALALVAFLYLTAISVALALIDLETHRLPNAIVLPPTRSAPFSSARLRSSGVTGMPSCAAAPAWSPWLRSISCSRSCPGAGWASAMSSSPASWGCTSAGAGGDRCSWGPSRRSSWAACSGWR